MEQSKEITLKVNISAKNTFLLLVLALMLWRPGLLDSAQTMTMTSYYPAPYGGYNQLLSKGNTYLADSAGADLRVNRYGGRTYIGNSSVTRTTSGSSSSISYMHQYGSAYLGYIGDSTSTAPTSQAQNGSTHIGYQSGQAYVGYGHYSSYVTTANGYAGLFSSVPIATNRHIYIGNGGNVLQKGSSYAISTSSQYKNPVKMLINLSGEGNTSASVDNPIGFLVAKDYYTAFVNIDAAEGSYGQEAIFGGGKSTRMRLMSDGYPAITGDTGLPLYIKVHGQLYVQGDIILDTKRTTSSTAKTQIRNLCYQKAYGTGSTATCKSGYVAIGFLPHNGRNSASKIVTSYDYLAGGSYSQNPMLYTQDTRGTAQGFMTCCAMEVPIEY